MEYLRNQYKGTPTTTDNPDSTISPSPTPEPTPVVIPGKPDTNGIYTENSTINGEDSSAFNPEIPKGFKTVNVDDAEWGDGSTTPTQDAVKKRRVIEDGEEWIEMLDDRNLTSHTYDEIVAREIYNNIIHKYYQNFVKLEEKLKSEMEDGK